MLVEVRVQSLGVERSSDTPVVILHELGGDRILPIWIGPSEAHAIAIQLADLESPRPLTQDLLVSVMKGFGGTVQKVIITRVENSTYYAELILQRDGEVISLDARPSDSIAVALRVDARIFAQDELLQQNTIQIAEEESAGSPSESPDEGFTQAMDPEELKEHLRKLNPEDFGRFTP